jgi:hypothetical protein
MVGLAQLLCNQFRYKKGSFAKNGGHPDAMRGSDEVNQWLNYPVAREFAEYVLPRTAAAMGRSQNSAPAGARLSSQIARGLRFRRRGTRRADKIDPQTDGDGRASHIAADAPAGLASTGAIAPIGIIIASAPNSIAARTV